MKDRIRELMEAQHMNQQTFSHYTGIGTATLSSIFTGRTRPTLNTIESIMKKFPEVNVNWLMFGEGDMYVNNSDTLPTEGQASPSADDIYNNWFATSLGKVLILLTSTSPPNFKSLLTIVNAA